jgi:hypothetical protein
VIDPRPPPLFDAHLHVIDPRYPLVANEGRRAQWLGLGLIVALRLGIHLYYGIGYAAVMVVPRMLGAWLLCRAIGAIWPLIVGHVLYDAALLTVMRTGHTWPYTALQIAAGIGAILLVTTVARTANRTGWIRWRESTRT